MRKRVGGRVAKRANETEGKRKGIREGREMRIGKRRIEKEREKGKKLPLKRQIKEDWSLI